MNIKIYLFVFFVFICANFAQDRVAIFDYDIRSRQEMSIADYIRIKMHEVDSLVKVDTYSGNGNDRDAITVLKEIDTLEYKLIITITTNALLVAKNVVKQTPVLFTNVNNPLFLGIPNVETPGAKFSGVSYYVPIEQQIAFFKIISPKMKRVGCFFDANNLSGQIEAEETRVVFNKENLELIPAVVHGASELNQFTMKMLSRNVDAIILSTSNLFYENVELIAELTSPAGIPVFSYHKDAVPNGAIASLSSDYFRMVDELLIPMSFEIIHNNKPIESMPIRFLKKNIISINKTEAEKIGLTIPEKIQEKADFTY